MDPLSPTSPPTKPRSASYSESRPFTKLTDVSFDPSVPQNTLHLQIPPRSHATVRGRSPTRNIFQRSSSMSSMPTSVAIPQSPSDSSHLSTPWLYPNSTYPPNIEYASTFVGSDDGISIGVETDISERDQSLNSDNVETGDEDVDINKCRLMGTNFKYPISQMKDGDDPKILWDKLYDRVKKDDQNKCLIWKEEIDKLLVFAGLFAATVVAFIVVAYQLLQPSQTEMRQTMHEMLLIMHKVKISNATGGALEGIIDTSPNNFTPSSSVLRINAVWFLSMTLSLGTVLVGTICLQWIREYQRETRLGSKQAFAVRQMRHDGLEAWKVPLVCSLLSLSLQSALFLFFWGLLEFLWNLNTAITVVNAIVIGCVGFIVIANIVIPAMQCIFVDCERLEEYTQCPYKSPQARVFAVVAFSIAVWTIKGLRQLTGDPKLFEKKETFLKKLLAAKGWDWVSFDNQWQSIRIPPDKAAVQESCDIGRGLGLVGKNFVHDLDALIALYHLLRGIDSDHAFEALDIIAQSPLGLKSQFKGSPRDIYRTDLQSAMLLRELVTKNPELRETFLLHRVELMIRLANYHPPDQETELLANGEGSRLRRENGFLGNPLEHATQDLTERQGELGCQILMTFEVYLKNGLFPKKLWVDVVISIAERLAAATKTLPALVKTLVSFNKNLETFCRENSSDHDLKKLMHEYIRRMRNENVHNANFSSSLDSLWLAVTVDYAPEGKGKRR